MSTNETIQEVKRLSERAEAAVERLPYWRDTAEALVGNAGRAYNTAFLAVQMDLEPILKADKSNPFTKSRFATLGALLAEIRPILNKHGISLKQFCGTLKGHGTETKRWYSLPICTLFMHVESGEWEMVIVDLPVETTTYSYGSALTFGKRYGLQSLVGIATVDDDGAKTIMDRLSEKQAQEAANSVMETLTKVETLEGLSKWVEVNSDGIKLLSEASVALVQEAYRKHKAVLKENAAKSAPEKPKSKKDKPAEDAIPKTGGGELAPKADVATSETEEGKPATEAPKSAEAVIKQAPTATDETGALMQAGFEAFKAGIPRKKAEDLYRYVKQRNAWLSGWDKARELAASAEAAA